MDAWKFGPFPSFWDDTGISGVKAGSCREDSDPPLWSPKIPSKIEWDRIQTDPKMEVAIELLDTQVSGPWNVGPVGDFLERWRCGSIWRDDPMCNIHLGQTRWCETPVPTGTLKSSHDLQISKIDLWISLAILLSNHLVVSFYPLEFHMILIFEHILDDKNQWNNQAISFLQSQAHSPTVLPQQRLLQDCMMASHLPVEKCS